MSDKIFSTHPLHPKVTAELQSLGKLVVASAPTAEAIVAESADASIIVVRAPIPPEIFATQPRLRAAVRHGAGLDMIPLDAASAAGVLVANVPGVNAVTVAEHCIWSALALLRRYPAVRTDLRAAGWAVARSHSDHGRELSGRSLGIIGMGNVGQALFRIAHFGFGMKVLAVTSRPEALAEGARAATLQQVLSQSDVVVLACPLTAKTRGLIGPAELARMQPGSILVNVARGPVVDEAALVEALRSGAMGGAVLDVFDEQPLPHSHPYLSMRNVILTPHMAGITEESMLRMGQGVVGETRRILAGDKPLNFCNPDAWTRYQARFV
ncbi:NAD(P)-dependent oxidoreductase [Hoeflea sp. YIM 152468]|uniref:NAD(P)-dependent oxidoreductase n=1 Tax=Hoeflea sp. YIM 152468 TaxID=3031759 RepID=UPI0023DA38CF|nr:NAD(P)-dependent oxidoreductase [Hoeflea sp. YIM 152468]MDF1609946.1 NAD(P)-dependent oxidoreductase [Hoeflea sp. YIM 152468]